ncbi:Saccharopine dehydrogenase-domain-containing protein [Stachybotrys elegans]|uniref:Saccharopine dehydrogenase-domain-containing protein n=1 Tax=Stachybotrys elegans TaxID=80388 RepID=A0A8K0SQK5_9HYPO|nr:Saccharopine dehydrogenase-domain-containing protein [Stachybotrys elegans]
MTTFKADRQYGIVLLGATGYTGRLTAGVIAEQLPTNLKWAIAGRSRTKLENLAAELKRISPDRVQPAIEVVSFDNQDELDALVKRTNVCISLVLYLKVGTLVVKSCVENGTDYIDCDRGAVRAKQWIDAYHEQAKKNRAALILGAGYWVAPHDLMVWAAVRELARQTSLKTKEVILTNTIEIPIDISGGSAEDFDDTFTHDRQLHAESQDPWYISPIRGPEVAKSSSIIGSRRDSHLGLLADTALGCVDNRIFIHRTWGLLGGSQGYGPNFRYNEYNTATSLFDVILKVVMVLLLNVLLSSRLLYRYVLRPMFPSTGDGPDVTAQKQVISVGLEAVAVADGDESKRAVTSFHFPGGSYYLTAVCMAHGAASLLYSRKLEGGLEGGLLTAAFLGQDLIDRLNAVGAKFETKMV